MEILLSLIYFSIFSVFIYKSSFFKDTTISRHWFISIFGVKIIFSIILTAIYTYYYTDRATADIYKYFDDGSVMFNALHNTPSDYFKMLIGIGNDTSYFTETYYNNMMHWFRGTESNLFSDTHIIIRFNAFVSLFSFGHFQVHNVFINFISLLGLTAIYNTFKAYFHQTKKLLFYSVFLVPSVLFWGSGLLKESILFFSLGFFTLSIFKLLNHNVFVFNRKKIVYIIFIFITIPVMIYTKTYILAALLIPFLGMFINTFIIKEKAFISYSIAALVIILFSFNIKHINSNLNPIEIAILKQNDFNTLVKETKPKSAIEIPILKNNFSVLSNIPNALFNTFFRPFVWNFKSPLLLVTALENIFILVFIFIVFIFRKKELTHKNTFAFCLTFTLSLYIIIGLTTPIIGAISRYKIIGIPFLLIACSHLLDVEKLKQKLPLLNNIL